jgi:hypothetical protein
VSRVGPLVCPILVGRDEILALVERRFGDVLDGRGQSLLIAGDAGIGKTRLLSAIEDRASTAGFRAAAGGLSPQDLDVPGAALLDLARSMRRLPELAPLGRSRRSGAARSRTERSSFSESHEAGRSSASAGRH